MSSHYDTINEVVLDVKVVLQIIKHGEDDSRTAEHYDGFITGFSKEGITEVTNSFRNLNSQDIADDDYNSVVRNYQYQMLKSLRKENQDHIIVGFYRRVKNFNFMTRPDDLQSLMDFQKHNDKSCNGTIIIIYDQHRMSNGDFGIRAYRVSEKAIKMSEDAKGSRPFSVSNVKDHDLTFNEILVEIPTTIRSTHLMNCLLHQIENDRLNQLERNTIGTLNSQICANKFGDELIAPAYSIASTTNLQDQTELMKKTIEEIHTDTNRFITNQRSLYSATTKKYSYINQRERDNEDRVKNGDKAIPVDIEEIDKIVKMPEEYNRLPGLIHSYQGNLFCESVKNISAGNVGKLFVAEAIQDQ